MGNLGHYSSKVERRIYKKFTDASVSPISWPTYDHLCLTSDIFCACYNRCHLGPCTVPHLCWRPCTQIALCFISVSYFICRCNEPELEPSCAEDDRVLQLAFPLMAAGSESYMWPLLVSDSWRKVQESAVPTNSSCKHTREHVAVIFTSRNTWH